MKRRSRRSTSSSTFILSVPATWLRKPSSRYWGTNSMPDLPSRSDRVTSTALLPIDETTPRPVTTTRFMSAGRRGDGRVLDQADPQAADLVDWIAVGMDDAICNAQRELAQHHALEMHVVGELAHRRHNHAGKLDLADAQRPAASWRLHPAQEKAEELPQRVERQAARHHRIALEVAGEEPELGLHVELGHDLALAIAAALVVDLHDAIEHQHWR